MPPRPRPRPGRSAVCPKPQRVARPRRLKILAPQWLATRCELGQLAPRGVAVPGGGCQHRPGACSPRTGDGTPPQPAGETPALLSAERGIYAASLSVVARTLKKFARRPARVEAA
jgi:hypothetical protein